MNILYQIRRLCRLFPEMAACPLCHEKAEAHGFCVACFADFDALTPPPVCSRCGNISVDGSVCGNCQRHPSHFDALWASFDYAAPLSTLLHHWKYRSLPQYSRSMAGLMGKHPPQFAEPTFFDWIVPVPLSRKRLFERGFHHSSVLAQVAADYYGVPVLPPSGIVRTHRPAQISLNRAMRLRNLKDSFSVQFDVNRRHLLLIDDVVTTGATLDELARSLKEKGAKRVYAWVLAHKLNVKNLT